MVKKKMVAAQRKGGKYAAGGGGALGRKYSRRNVNKAKSRDAGRCGGDHQFYRAGYHRRLIVDINGTAMIGTGGAKAEARDATQGCPH